MKKCLIIVVALLAIVVNPILGQISMYDKLEYAKPYRSFSLEEMLAPAMIMRQRHDANSEKINKLVERIYELKDSTDDKILNNALDKHYDNLEKLYYRKDGLANADRDISLIQHAVLKDVNEYKRRISAAKDEVQKSESKPREIKKSVRRSNPNPKQEQIEKFHLVEPFVSGNPYGVRYDDLISSLTKEGTSYQINLELEEYLKDLGTTSVTFISPALSSVTKEKITTIIIMYFSEINGEKISFSNKILYPLDEFKYVLAKLNNNAEKVDNFKWKSKDAIYAIDIESDLFTVLATSNFTNR